VKLVLTWNNLEGDAIVVKDNISRSWRSRGVQYLTRVNARLRQLPGLATVNTRYRLGKLPIQVAHQVLSLDTISKGSR
jgi:hypothetical protein